MTSFSMVRGYCCLMMHMTYFFEMLLTFNFPGKKQNNRRDLNKAVRKDHNFTFDVVFGPDSDNEAVFVSTTKDLVDVLFDGYNCSV